MFSQRPVNRYFQEEDVDKDSIERTPLAGGTAVFGCDQGWVDVRRVCAWARVGDPVGLC